MRDFQKIDYRLFEFVLLDPKAAYEFPLLIETLGLAKGFILLNNEKAPIGKQIEAANIKNFSRNRMDEVLSLIEYMEVKEQGPVTFRLGSDDPKDLKDRYLVDAEALEKTGFDPICIVSKSNLGKYKFKRENEVEKFLKKSIKTGKMPSYPREPEVAGLVLRHVFTKQVFSDFVKFISIVDPYIDVIGNLDDDNPKKNKKVIEERTDTLECIEKICQDLTVFYEQRAGKEKNSSNLQVNIFFKVKSLFRKQIFKDRFKDYIKSSKYGFFGGPKRKIDLTFYGLSEKPNGQRLHLRWLFSNCFLINHTDGICSHNLRWEKNRSKIDKSEIIWSLIKTLDEEDFEITTTDEDNHPHATLKEFKKLYSHNSQYFDVDLKGWTAPIFEDLEISPIKELTEV